MARSVKWVHHFRGHKCRRLLCTTRTTRCAGISQNEQLRLWSWSWSWSWSHSVQAKQQRADPKAVLEEMSSDSLIQMSRSKRGRTFRSRTKGSQSRGETEYRFQICIRLHAAIPPSPVHARCSQRCNNAIGSKVARSEAWDEGYRARASRKTFCADAG